MNVIIINNIPAIFHAFSAFSKSSIEFHLLLFQTILFPLTLRMIPIITIGIENTNPI